MTLGELRAWLALWAEWWKRRPTLVHPFPDMTTPQAVAHGVPALTLPREVQILFLKAPPLTLGRTLAHMENLDRGYPDGGVEVVLTMVRPRGEKLWKYSRFRAVPPEETITRRAG